jgi:hypothetical protein
VRLSRLAPQTRRTRMATIVAMALAIATCAGGDIAAQGRLLAGQQAGGAVVTLTADAGAKATIRPAHIPIPIPPQQETSYTTGFANVRKLGSSALLGEPPPAIADLDIAVFQTLEISSGSDCDDPTGPECTLIAYSTGQLNYKGLSELPPVTATFLAYGFMPVTATMQLLDEPSNCPAPTSADANHTVSAGLCLLTIEEGSYPVGQETTGTAVLAVHVSSVKVNGTSLNVGSHCQARRADLQVVGSSSGTLASVPPGQFAINLGGTLTGSVSIPAFTGCVTPAGENLNPLLTSAVSGVGNDVQLTEGNLCPVPADGCVTVPPVPGRGEGQPLLYTFQGGSQTGTISCASADLPTVITGRAGTIGAIGAVGSFGLGGCTAQVNGEPDGATCTAKASGLPWPVNSVSYDPIADQATGTIGDASHPVDFDLTCKGPRVPACSVEESSTSLTQDGPGSVNVIYDYRSRTLTIFGAGVAPVSSDCPGFFAGPPELNDFDELFIPPYVVNSSPPGPTP